MTDENDYHVRQIHLNKSRLITDCQALDQFQ